MTLSRDELAARCLTSLLTRDGYTATSAAEVAVVAADALLHALKPAEVAPVAATAGKYVPKVGDVVDYGQSEPRSENVYLGRNAEGNHRFWSLDEKEEQWSSEVIYLRDSTDSEKRAAGLAVPPPAPAPAPEVCCASPLCPHSSPGGGTSQVGGAAERDAGIVTPASPTPAPEAKRPTHVRVTKIADTGFDVAVGSVYEVVRWYDDGGGAVSPQVMADNGELVELAYVDHSDADYCPSWEPAHCPPPVAGRGEKDEAVRGLVAFAARVSDTLRLDGTKRNADLVTEAGRLVALAKDAGLIEVRP